MSNKPRRGDFWVPPPARTSKRSKYLGKTAKAEDMKQTNLTSNSEKLGTSILKPFITVDVGCQTVYHHPSSKEAFFVKLEKYHKDLKVFKSHGHSFNACSELIHRPRTVAAIDERMMKSLIFQSDQHILFFLQALEDFQSNVLGYEESFNDDIENFSRYATLSEESKDFATIKLLKAYDVVTSAMKYIFDIQLQSDLSHLEDDRNIQKQHSETLKKDLIARDSHLQQTEKKLSHSQEEVTSLLRQKLAVEDKNTQLLKELSHTNLLLEQMKLQAESQDHLMKNAEENDKLLQIIEDLHSRNEAEKNALKKAIKVQKQRADEYKENSDELTIKLAEKEQKCYNLSAERDEWKGQLTTANNDLIEAQRRVAEIQSKNIAIREQMAQIESHCDRKVIDGDVTEKPTPFQESKAENELACEMLREETKNLISLLQEVKSLFHGNLNILSQRDGNIRSDENQTRDDALYSLIQEMRDQLTETYKICQQCTESLARNHHIESLEKECTDLKDKLQNEIQERRNLQKQCDELQSTPQNLKINLPSNSPDKRQHSRTSFLDDVSDQVTALDQSNCRVQKQDMNEQFRNLEIELNNKNSRISTLEMAKNQMEEKHAAQLSELKEKLERATATSESMKKYVELLKSSYINVFGVS